MNDIAEDLGLVRSKICDMILFASALFAFPTAAASVYRSFYIGWQWQMGVHIGSVFVIWGIFFLRKSIPYTVRAGLIVGLFFIIGLIGFWNVGIVSGANPLLLLSPVLATVLFGKRIGIPFVIIMIFFMVVTAYTFVFGDRVFVIDPNSSKSFSASWITYLLTVVLGVTAAIAAISMSNHHLASALFKSRKSQNDLIHLNNDLENQVAIRTQELNEAKKKAEEQARTDVLTGLNNRRAFFEYGEVIKAQSRRYNHTYVIVMIDIDHFKKVNDTLGHDAGDETLKTVGKIISQGLRETDIIGRIGGEEFAIIMPETVLNEAALLAERLRLAMETTLIKTQKGDVKVTLSIGIAAGDNPQSSLEKVMAFADAALYLAKDSGRNQVQCH